MTTPRHTATLQQKLRRARTLLREIARKDEAALQALMDAGTIEEIPPDVLDGINKVRSFLRLGILDASMKCREAPLRPGK